ncbi:hypothetical protein ACIPY3_16200 [Paenarthrobacter sp. NPDC089714]|uniref:hypothetical protein n=1 Tax=Paenarthrobacter sp. NPDC089714 TaxID=3364377 RepID=UPI00382B77B3
MAPNSVKTTYTHGVAPFAAPIAQRGASRPHDLPNKPDALLGAIAVRQLFRRWPLVPTRELERIRHVLVHCDQLGSPDAHHLSEPAQALLDLITSELNNRREAAKAAHPAGGRPLAPVKPPTSPASGLVEDHTASAS